MGGVNRTPARLSNCQFSMWPVRTSEALAYPRVCLVGRFILLYIQRVELQMKRAPNQSSEPTLASGTPPAGQEPCLP